MVDYRPWTWKAPENSSDMSRAITRQDGFERVSGQAVFTRDVNLPGMLYAKILMSPYAHARIARIDISEAAALVGVRDILKYDDPDIAFDNENGPYFEVSRNYNILTLPRTSDFYDHPMGVVVVADSEEICDRALRLLKIDWEERPFILDMEESLRPDAPKIMPEVKRMNPKAKEPNTVLTDRVEIGNLEKGFSEADKVIEYTITRARNTTAGVEPIVCVAQWRGDFLDLWIHHQDLPFGVLTTSNSIRGKNQPPIADWTKITVTMPYQGSWYGGFAWLAYSYSFIRLAAILARRAAGKPVKLLWDESGYYCGGDDAGTYKCKVGAKRDGTITSFHWHMVGIRNPAVEKTHVSTKIPNILGTQEWALINKGHSMCFRHGAHTCVPHNVMFDRVSAEMGLDPTEVALKNDGCNGHDWDWVTRYQKENGFPQRWSLKEVIEKGKKAIQWEEKWHPPGTRKLASGRMHGMGFIHVNEWHWHAPIPGISFACVTLRHGKAAIIAVRSDMGIDTESGARLCVASEVGLKYEDTVLQERRSDNSTFHFWQPGGSFGTNYITTQLILAARELRRKILEYAVTPKPSLFLSPERAPLFPNLKLEDLDIKDSMVFEKANPKNRRTVREVADEFWALDPPIFHPPAGTLYGLTLDGKPHPDLYAMARQAHFIEVEVDTEIGSVDVTRIVCVNDVGHLFNPEGAAAQQYGGAVMGLSRSGTEEHVYCPRTGVSLNYDLIGYHMGSMNDYPAAECLINESHLGYAAYGSYGIGENVGASMSGITVSAIHNATGKWVMDYPTTPDRVLKALGKI
ncbi:MAG: aldehyde oxidase and xanthine dehydrogenase molybdopterin binding protein [Acidobacteria bacterium]|nr:aldehyde oxidase and xanthine dehydrogenase molybdopterin binding protein [Acidobacteriota bacterium]